MTTLANRINQRGKASPWKALFNIARITLTIFVLVHAGMELDGWLSWAAWALAGWGTLVLFMTLFGLSALGDLTGYVLGTADWNVRWRAKRRLKSIRGEETP